jgi:cation:H+ antiporter
MGTHRFGRSCFLAIVTASPEVAVNITSAARGVSNIGLGNLLGSNIISIPLMVTIAYFASRKQFKNNPKHQEHLEANLLALNKRSVSVLSLPYLGIIDMCTFDVTNNISPKSIYLNYGKKKV